MKKIIIAIILAAATGYAAIQGIYSDSQEYPPTSHGRDG